MKTLPWIESIIPATLLVIAIFIGNRHGVVAASIVLIAYACGLMQLYFIVKDARLLENSFGELMDELYSAKRPLLPQPNWDQDTAYVAYVIDVLTQQRNNLRTALEARGVTTHDSEVIMNRGQF